MPRNQGTSRKGKPNKHDRASGMGQSLIKLHSNKYRPRMDGKNKFGDGGMTMTPGVSNIGEDAATTAITNTTKSILEVQDLDDFLVQAELANQKFAVEHEGIVILDSTSQAIVGHEPKVSWSDQPAAATPAFTFTELSVPRRPDWDDTTTPEELDQRERQSFLEWRRSIAHQEELLATTTTTSANITATPFEKNLQVWKQLWRVLERSNCIVQILDARNPLFYISYDLKDYCCNVLRKPMILVVNKSDYLSTKQRQLWYRYLTKTCHWDTVLFFSAIMEQTKLDLQAQQERQQNNDHQAFHDNDNPISDEDESHGDDDEDDDDNSEDDDNEDEDEVNKDETDIIQDVFRNDAGNNDDAHDNADTNNDNGDTNFGIDTPLSRQGLLDAMLLFAEKNNCEPDPKYGNRIQYGMVGFPNVGKSSVINVLVGSSKHTHGLVRVGVASQPGKTKHFQTLLLPDNDNIMLCDCPGLVFPSFVSNTADLIAAGVYPIAQMRDHWPVVQLICTRIPRPIMEALYGIQLPSPTMDSIQQYRNEQQQSNNNNNSTAALPPPTPEEFLGTLCIARGMLAANSGVPDYQRAARMVIKDYAVGKLLYCHPPPDIVVMDDNDDHDNDDDVVTVQSFYNETIQTALYHTKKLQEKLVKQQLRHEKTQLQQQQQQQRTMTQMGGDNDHDVLDDDILALIGIAGQQQQKSSLRKQRQQQRGLENPEDALKHGKKGRTPKSKWGKKDRKNRNEDPYGCHLSPDDVLLQNTMDASSIAAATTAGGLIVNGGRYTHTGYTRPNSYPSMTSRT